MWCKYFSHKSYTTGDMFVINTMVWGKSLSHRRYTAVDWLIQEVIRTGLLGINIPTHNRDTHLPTAILNEMG